MWRPALAAALLFAQPCAAVAQGTELPLVAVPDLPMRLMAGTVVEIELAETVHSQRNKTGQPFGFRLRKAIMVDGRVVVPAGTLGVGEIVHAKRASNEAGELILAARYVDYGGVHVPLRALHLAGSGAQGYAVTAYAAGTVVTFGSAPGDIQFPFGTVAEAKVATDVVLPPPTASGPQAP